jgi:preprotein translocase subunit SecA
MLSKQIEKAQRKVEEQNFLIRKRVLEFDDVMNQQREVVYEYRDRILEGRDMGEEARDQIAQVVDRMVEEYTPGDFVEEWDVDGMFTQLRQIWDVDVDPDELNVDQIDREELKRLLTDDAHELYEEREEELGEELMRALERYLLLEIIDQRWREHLYDMDYLREGIHLRGFAQIDPLVAYKNEAFTLFQDLMHAIWSDFARMVFNVQVEIEGGDGAGDGVAAIPQRPAGGSSTTPGRVSYSGGGPVDGREAMALAAGASAEDAAAFAAMGAEAAAEAEQELEALPIVEQRRVDEADQIGRNDPCWCGSGKKFKKCHGS